MPTSKSGLEPIKLPGFGNLLTLGRKMDPSFVGKSCSHDSLESVWESVFMGLNIAGEEGGINALKMWLTWDLKKTLYKLPG